MRHPNTLLFASVVVFLATCVSWAQAPRKFTILVPDTTVERPQDRGVRAHTNHLIRVEAKPSRGGGGPSGEPPATIRPVYNLPTTGGSQTIAIVDAYDYATAANDLGVFSSPRSGCPPCRTAAATAMWRRASGKSSPPVPSPRPIAAGRKKLRSISSGRTPWRPKQESCWWKRPVTASPTC